MHIAWYPCVRVQRVVYGCLRLFKSVICFVYVVWVVMFNHLSMAMSENPLVDTPNTVIYTCSVFCWPQNNLSGEERGRGEISKKRNYVHACSGIARRSSSRPCIAPQLEWRMRHVLSHGRHGACAQLTTLQRSLPLYWRPRPLRRCGVVFGERPLCGVSTSVVYPTFWGSPEDAMSLFSPDALRGRCSGAYFCVPENGCT